MSARVLAGAVPSCRRHVEIYHIEPDQILGPNRRGARGVVCC